MDLLHWKYQGKHQVVVVALLGYSATISYCSYNNRVTKGCWKWILGFPLLPLSMRTGSNCWMITSTDCTNVGVTARKCSYSIGERSLQKEHILLSHVEIVSVGKHDRVKDPLVRYFGHCHWWLSNAHSAVLCDVAIHEVTPTMLLL